MAFNYTNPAFPQAPTQQNTPQNFTAPVPQAGFSQNIQPLFPQPQGNVYNINSTLEVANVPAGAGISVALCLNEGLMYIKSMQNGNPLFLAYRITPFDNVAKSEEAAKPNEQAQTQSNPLLEKFENYDQRFLTLEEQIDNINKILKNSKRGSDLV